MSPCWWHMPQPADFEGSLSGAVTYSDLTNNNISLERGQNGQITNLKLIKKPPRKGGVGKLHYRLDQAGVSGVAITDHAFDLA